MQLSVYNHTSKRTQCYRITNAEDLFKLADKYPRLHRLIMTNAESDDLLKKVVTYLNRQYSLHAKLIEDNPMRKNELSIQDPEVFRTRIHAWATKRAAHSREPLTQKTLEAPDPGRLSESKEEDRYPNSLIGKLAEKFNKWRGGK